MWWKLALTALARAFPLEQVVALVLTEGLRRLRNAQSADPVRLREIGERVNEAAGVFNQLVDQSVPPPAAPETLRGALAAWAQGEPTPADYKQDCR